MTHTINLPLVDILATFTLILITPLNITSPTNDITSTTNNNSTTSIINNIALTINSSTRTDKFNFTKQYYL